MATGVEQTNVRPRRWTQEEYCRLADLGFFTGQPVELLDGEIFLHCLDQDPSPRRWTKEEYYRLADAGFFRGQRVELIEGTIVVLSPQRFEHSLAVDRAAERLRLLFAEGYWIRMQLPLDLGLEMELEPDISVVIGKRADYSTGHPTTATLIIEVSDTTLKDDRQRKASLYARAGIPDYWIVNLVDQQVEVHRDPVEDSSAVFGFRYASCNIVKEPARLTPLALPGANLAVAELLRG